MSRKRVRPAAPATGYRPPVERLLTLGRPGGANAGSWHAEPFADYASMGISRADTGELLRLARDWSLGDQREPDSYGPVHACRALAAVGAAEAVPDLIRILARLDERNDYYWMDDVQVVLGLLGALEGEDGDRAIDVMRRAYLDAREPWGVRLFIGGALERTAAARPQRRHRVTATYGELLSLGRFADGGLVGGAIASLVTLGAADMLPAIRRAFDAGNVDMLCCGPLETVEKEIVMTPEERKAALAAQIDARERELEQEVEQFGVETVLLRAIERMRESTRAH